MKRNKLFRVAYAHPYSQYRLYGPEKYSLQNMLLKEVNFPDLIEDGKGFDVYEDRIPTKWMDALQLIQSTGNADHLFPGATDESFLAFARKIAESVGFEHPVTGARVVRFTDVSSGYPCLRLDLASGGRKEKRATRTSVYHWPDEVYGA